MDDDKHVYHSQVDILNFSNHKLQLGAKVLDLGCGNGGVVSEYRKNGYDAYGCDFQFKEGSEVATLYEKNIIRLVEGEPYRLPFDDGMFDLVLTNQVMEHVQDYGSTLTEMKRVMKDGAAALHIFPSKYRPIETHVYVPFAGVIQLKWWLNLWAQIGIRSSGQKGMSAKKIAMRNYEYLTKNTNYLTRKDLETQFLSCFPEVHFCETNYLKTTRRARKLASVAEVFPWVSSLYSTFRTRVVLCIK